MLFAFYIAGGLAIALHFFIFYLESFAWSTRATKVFGHTKEQAGPTKEIAFNMGFYNLFLALIALGGVLLIGGNPAVGTALAVAGFVLDAFARPDADAGAGVIDSPERDAAVEEGVVEDDPIIDALPAGN